MKTDKEKFLSVLKRADGLTIKNFPAIRKENGKFQSEDGYFWVNPELTEDPNDHFFEIYWNHDERDYVTCFTEDNLSQVVLRGDIFSLPDYMGDTVKLRFYIKQYIA